MSSGSSPMVLGSIPKCPITTWMRRPIDNCGDAKPSGSLMPSSSSHATSQRRDTAYARSRGTFSTREIISGSHLDKLELAGAVIFFRGRASSLEPRKASCFGVGLGRDFFGMGRVGIGASDVYRLTNSGSGVIEAVGPCGFAKGLSRIGSTKQHQWVRK